MPWPAGESHSIFLPSSLIPWPTEGGWHCPIFVLHHLTSHPMTNRLWVTLPFFCNALHLIPWWTGCEWNSPFPVMKCHFISFCGKQEVSGTTISLLGGLITSHPGMLWQFVSGIDDCISCDLITSHPMTNREWVTLPCLSASCLTTSCSMTNSLWVISPILLTCSLIALHPMTNSLCAPFSYHAVSSHLIPWSTGGEQHSLFLLYSLITSHFMTYRQWVMLSFFYHVTSSLPTSQWKTGSVWHSLFFCYCLIGSHHMTNRMWVKLAIVLCMPCSLITSPTVAMTIRLWVTLAFVCRQSDDCILIYDQQNVSGTTLFLAYSLVTLHLTNRVWVSLPFFCHGPWSLII